jgi:hypothetical protein
MKTETIRLLIIIFVAVPLFTSILIPAGQPPYRLKERVEAMQAYTLNKSASTKLTLDDEFTKLHQHEKTQGIILVPALLLADAAVIYFFWNYGTRKTTA